MSHRTASPRLMAITDMATVPLPVIVERLEALCALARPGAVVVQLRDKDRPARVRLELGSRLRDVTLRHGQLLVVNDRCDVAAALGADGVHLPEDGLGVDEARALLPRGSWISVASHDANRAFSGVDAVVLSPVMAPRKGRSALGEAGVAVLRQTLDSARHEEAGSPLIFALGGVVAANVARCLQAGADGVAAIGTIFVSSDHKSLLRALDALRRA